MSLIKRGAAYKSHWTVYVLRKVICRVKGQKINIFYILFLYLLKKIIGIKFAIMLDINTMHG
jgi:hypothetical protein